MNIKGKRVFVGLSGGVDSAVSAALLKQAGARVTGVFIKGWYPPEMPCTWREDRQDAMRAAAKLHIPFETFDASSEYKQSVIDYLLAEYKAGHTPNPDALCNRDIKFGAFYRFAKENGAEHIATGHYRAGEKDQSYFLALVPEKILAETIFPVGHLDKSETRALAHKFGLPVAEKKDSQGVCFLGSISVKEFLEAELGPDEFYLRTIGERVDGKQVIGKEDGHLIFGDLPNVSRIQLREVNLHMHSKTATIAQYRYRGPKVRGHLEGACFIAENLLSEVPAPGQLLALYDAKGELAGGGIIDSYA